MRLYDIATGIRQILDKADPESGELPENLAAEFDALNLSMDEKVNGTCALVREEQANAKAAREEAQRLTDLARCYENHVERLKSYLQECLTVAGVQRYDTALFKCWRQASPPSYVMTLDDPAKLPREFQRVTIAPDIVAVREWHKERGELPSGFTVKTSEHLRIK